jgi:hypothetical protein
METKSQEQKITEVELGPKEVLAFKQLEDAERKIRDKKNEFVVKLMAKHGVPVVRGSLKLETPDENGKQWFRVTLTDNLKAIVDGATLWKSTAFSRYSVSTDMLKNEPKKVEHAA